MTPSFQPTAYSLEPKAATIRLSATGYELWAKATKGSES